MGFFFWGGDQKSYILPERGEWDVLFLFSPAVFFFLFKGATVEGYKRGVLEPAGLAGGSVLKLVQMGGAGHLPGHSLCFRREVFWRKKNGLAKKYLYVSYGAHESQLQKSNVLISTNHHLSFSKQVSETEGVRVCRVLEGPWWSWPT